MANAREEILGSVRRNIQHATGRKNDAEIGELLSAHARNLIPARSDLDAEGVIELFEQQAQGVQATTVRIASMDRAAAAVVAYLKAENLPARLVMAPDPDLDDAPWDDQPMLEIRRGLPKISDEVGVTSALGAVAETGTLVAVSGPDHPSTLNFVPETHIVILPASRIKKSYEDIWDEIRARGPLPRTVNFITGPSRSGDIEQTLQLGAHGPRRLHIIVVDGDGKRD